MHIKNLCSEQNSIFIEEIIKYKNIKHSKIKCKCGKEFIRRNDLIIRKNTALCKKCLDIAKYKNKYGEYEKRYYYIIEKLYEAKSSDISFLKKKEYETANRVQLFIRFKCKCGKYVERRPKNFKICLCKECAEKITHKVKKSYIYRGNLNKLLLKEVRQLFIVSGCFPLFFNYENYNKKLKAICFCGKQFEDSVNSFYTRKYFACPTCIKHNVRTPKKLRKTNNRPPLISCWYSRILKKFNFKCFLTGEKGGMLSAHHLFGYANFPEKRFDLNNGICIKKEIHVRFHKENSNRIITPELFFSWAKENNLINIKGVLI